MTSRHVINTDDGVRFSRRVNRIASTNPGMRYYEVVDAISATRRGIKICSQGSYELFICA